VWQTDRRTDVIVTLCIRVARWKPQQLLNISDSPPVLSLEHANMPMSLIFASTGYAHHSLQRRRLFTMPRCPGVWPVFGLVRLSHATIDSSARLAGRASPSHTCCCERIKWQRAINGLGVVTCIYEVQQICPSTGVVVIQGVLQAFVRLPGSSVGNNDVSAF